MGLQAPSQRAENSPVVWNGQPVGPVGRWTQALVQFFQIEAASGILLLFCTVVSLALANSPWSSAFADFWQTYLGVTVAGFELKKPLLLWINDGLMTIFFFVVGLEIKRELVAGELRDARKAALPVAAALGGMIAPALVYLAWQQGQAGERGWGIPMATDIAFVVGFLALLGNRVPAGLKIVLLSLAIVDDIGSILVIALFYSSGISSQALGVAALGLAATIVLRYAGMRSVGVYVVVGAAIWLAVLKSGVHPTVAGVLLGLLTPAYAWLPDRTFLNVANDALARLRGEKGELEEEDRLRLIATLRMASREAVSPLERLETALHPWVAYFIMPLFALANAGVPLQLGALSDPVALAVASGLVVGKPLGIVLCSWLAVQAGLARLPAGMNWKVLLGGGFLAGIGFTMSLFIAGLALEGSLLAAGKIGTLLGSVISAMVGVSLLYVVLPGQSADKAEEIESALVAQGRVSSP